MILSRTSVAVYDPHASIDVVWFSLACVQNNTHTHTHVHTDAVLCAEHDKASFAGFIIAVGRWQMCIRAYCSDVEHSKCIMRSTNDIVHRHDCCIRMSVSDLLSYMCFCT